MQAAAASPLAGPGSFSPGANLLTFNSVVNACSNTIPGRFPCGGTPWTIGDVTISQVGDGSFDGWAVPNFGIGLGQSLSDNEAKSDWTLQFAQPFTQIGMLVVLGGTYEVSFFRGATLLGTVDVVNSAQLGFRFAGWADAEGIDRIRIFETVANGNLMAIDDLRWEGTPAPIPEPSSMLLMSAGLLGALLWVRRRV